MANLLEGGNFNKFTVIKNDDLSKYVGINGLTAIEAVEDVIKANKILDGRRINNQYLVINVDEPYADKVIELMKEHEHWG